VELQRGMKRRLGDADVMTLTKARKSALKLLQRHDDGEKIESRLDQNPTLKSFVEDTYQPWVDQNLKRGSESVNRLLRSAEPLGSTRLDKLSEVQIERWKMQRLKSGLAASTVRRDLTELKAALTRAVKWGYITSNPARHVKVKVETHHRVRYLTDNERTALLDALEERDRKRRKSRRSGNVFRLERGYQTKPELGDFTDYLTPLILLVMNTGLRRSEALSLTWGQTTLVDNPHLTVLAAHAKSGKTRHVPLNSSAVEVLKRWRKQSEQKGLVFPNPAGGQLKSIKTAWGKLMKDAKIKDFRFHDLRHDFASRLVMNGVDLYRVKELLGHGSIEVTQRYAHLAPHTLAEAVEVLV
jgi:integrase